MPKNLHRGQIENNVIYLETMYHGLSSRTIQVVLLTSKVPLVNESGHHVVYVYKRDGEQMVFDSLDTLMGYFENLEDKTYCFCADEDCEIEDFLEGFDFYKALKGRLF